MSNSFDFYEFFSPHAPKLFSQLDDNRHIRILSDAAGSLQRFPDFPGGTDHSPTHYAAVFRWIERLLDNTSLMQKETFYLVAAALVHDVLHYMGRQGHADLPRLQNEMQQIVPSLSEWDQALIAFVAAAHTGRGRLERLAETDHTDSDGRRIRLEAIAAILRFADELAEGPDRTAPQLELAIPPESEQFHLYAQCISYVLRPDEWILATIRCSPSVLRRLAVSTEAIGTELMLSAFLRRISKLEQERRYCSRFFPPGVSVRGVKLRIHDPSQLQPWFEDLFTDPEQDRWNVYGAFPDMLIPNDDTVDSEDMYYHIRSTVVSGLSQLFGSRLLSVALFGSSATDPTNARDIDLLAIVTEHVPHVPGDLIDNAISQLRSATQKPVSLDIHTASTLLDRLALGDPFVISATREGICLLQSTVFFSAKLFSSQNLIFPYSRLVNILLDFVRTEVERFPEYKSLYLERPLSATSSMYRAVFTAAQALVIDSQQFPGGRIPISYILQVSKKDQLRKALQNLPCIEKQQLIHDFDAVIHAFHAAQTASVSNASANIDWKSTQDAFEQFIQFVGRWSFGALKASYSDC